MCGGRTLISRNSPLFGLGDRMSGDQKSPPYSLPKWKRIPQLDEKGSGGAKDTIAAVVLEATTKEIKELFLKIKVDSSFERNYKVL